MTKYIIGAVVAGMLTGHFFLPNAFIDMTNDLMVVGLCILLFFVGVDLGTEGTVVANMKRVGARILVFPLATILGTFAGVIIASFFLNISVIESLIIGSGFGWYSLSPLIIAPYSIEISAISFLHNVSRELIGIILIPIVAAKIGYVECTSLPGAAAMDTSLPIIEKATNGDIVVYSFLSGLSLSVLVPILIPFFISLV